jgi:hypothetical protein
LQSIVPQLSGKSAILKKLVPDGIDEISVDDVPQSYEKVPIGVVLSQLSQPNSSHVSSSAEEFVDKNTYGQSVFSRIAELKEAEQGLLIKLFTGSVSFSDSEAALRASVSESDREILTTCTNFRFLQYVVSFFISLIPISFINCLDVRYCGHSDSSSCRVRHTHRKEHPKRCRKVKR